MCTYILLTMNVLHERFLFQRLAFCFCIYCHFPLLLRWHIAILNKIKIQLVKDNTYWENY